MRKQVSAARRENAPVLDDASVLFAQKGELEIKSELLDAFNKHFVMPEEDLMVLSTASDAVDDHFFAVLKQVRQIYTDCQVLLGNENETIGFRAYGSKLSTAQRRLSKALQMVTERV